MRTKFLLSGVSTGIRRNATMTIALVLSSAIALGFVGTAILANTEISRFKQKYEDKINVSVYLCAQLYSSDSNCTHKTTSAETSTLQSMLTRDPLVRSVQYVSETEAYQRAKQQQSLQIAQFLKPGDLPASFVVKLHNLKSDYAQFANKYARTPGVGQVNNRIDTINTLLGIIDNARLLSIIIAAIVLVASILLIANAIQVAASQRRNETSIMRLVGASRWMTELPFMLEAVLSAATGGVVAFGLIALGKQYVFFNVFAGPTKSGVIPDLSLTDVLSAGGAGVAIGIVLSALTAFVTLRFRVKL